MNGEQIYQNIDQYAIAFDPQGQFRLVLKKGFYCEEDKEKTIWDERVERMKNA
jgi:hypothetical protein